MSLPQTPLGPVCWPAFLGPARLQLYFLSHQQDFSAAVSGPVMDVDSCMNSLCKTRLFSSKDDAFQILL